MTMLSQPRGIRRCRIGRRVPVDGHMRALVHEIIRDENLVGHTFRQTRDQRTTGWWAVPAGEVQSRWFGRHTDAMHWLAGG